MAGNRVLAIRARVRASRVGLRITNLGPSGPSFTRGDRRDAVGIARASARRMALSTSSMRAFWCRRERLSFCRITAEGEEVLDGLHHDERQRAPVLQRMG